MSLFGFPLFEESTTNSTAGRFSQDYKAFSHGFSSLSQSKQRELSRGGKILLPSSALERLTQLKVDYPMLFKLVNENKERSTYCGVLEFTSEDKQAILPYWIMKNLLLDEGEQVKIEYCTLPTATFARFQPKSASFLDISDPKAVLENAFRSFACLAKGDVISIYYNEECYELLVKELKPADAVVIIECDLHFEFEEPEGHVSTFIPRHNSNAKVQKDVEEYLKKKASFSAFSGSGKRLDGKRNQKAKPGQTAAGAANTESYERGLPNYDWTFGELNFLRLDPVVEEEKSEEESFKVFSGQGQSLIKLKSKSK